MKLHRLNGHTETLCGRKGRLVRIDGRSGIMTKDGWVFQAAKLDEEVTCYFCLGLPQPSKGVKRPNYVRGDRR